MKRSGYRIILHIYLIFFLTLLAAILVSACLFFLLATLQQPDHSTVRSDWPKTMTENFKEHIIFVDGEPQVKQKGLSFLQDNHIGLQILAPSGDEIFHFQKPGSIQQTYSNAALLQLSQAGWSRDSQTTAFTGVASRDGNDYVYILYFPTKVSKVTMYLNGERFTGGKTVLLLVLGILCFMILAFGVFYGFLTAKAMKRLTTSVGDIALRRYVPVQNHGVFHDLYNDLNTLDAEIKASDQLRAQAEKMQKEWIANTTHDLKTPLSPIRGYAELLQDGMKSTEQCKRYAGIILKNTSYIETLIDDLKLAYQLESSTLPIKRREQDMGRFFKELTIDILNMPEYENRVIHFESGTETILYCFDQTLLTRALRNLILNAFVHGGSHAQITLYVSVSNTALTIRVSDNGKGMEPEECSHIFDRYYRGEGAGQKPAGTGLGLAITKSIITLHGGRIFVSSTPGLGTDFQIELPLY